MSQLVFTIIVSFVTDFLITGGSTIAGGMIGQKAMELPSTAVWVLAVVLGVVSAARRVQAIMAQPPTTTTKTTETDPSGAKREVTTSATTPPTPKGPTP